MRKVALLVALGALFAGCIATGTKVSETQLMQFERGRTTYGEVVAALGTPNQSFLYDDGTRLIIYTYSQSQAQVVNYLPVAAAFLQGSTAEGSVVTLQFDAQGLLTTFNSTQGQTVTGTGFSSGARQTPH